MKRTNSTMNLFGPDPRDVLNHPPKIKKLLPQKYFGYAEQNIFYFIFLLFNENLEENNVDINTKDKTNGYTLYHYALKNGNSEVVNKLLSFGADPHLKSSLFDENHNSSLSSFEKYNKELIGFLPSQSDDQEYSVTDNF